MVELAAGRTHGAVARARVDAGLRIRVEEILRSASGGLGLVGIVGTGVARTAGAALGLGGQDGRDDG